MYSGTRAFINALEKEGELLRVTKRVSPHLEISEITDRLSKAGLDRNKALLFENTGTPFPVLINSMGSEKRIAMALGVNRLDDIAKEIDALFSTLTGPKKSLLEKLSLLPLLGNISSWMPKVNAGRGKCQEVIMEEPDITKLPVLTCWPEDGGPFLTLPIIHTKNPINGTRNVGLYRMQVFKKNLTAMHWHKHKVSAKHFNLYKELGQKMPVAVALGGDPSNTYCATAPLPEGVDEYMLSGFIRKKRVELVKCITQDIEVPSDADFIIEGYIDPAEDLILEGPFGDHTGYYSLPDFYPKFHITAITHRKDAVFPATIVGIPPQEDAWIGKATERIFIAPIRLTMLPELLDMVMPHEGVFHNLVLVKIKKEYPGHARKVVSALWGAGQMMLNKFLIVVDGSVDLNDYAALAALVSSRIKSSRDLIFSEGPLDVLDHACSNLGFGGKMAIDATEKFPEEVSPSTSKPLVRKPEMQKIPEAFEDIRDLNPEFGIILSIGKLKKGFLPKEAAFAFAKECASDKTQFLLIMDPEIPLNELGNILWRFTNNCDPSRDYIRVPMEKNTELLAFDGTMKTMKKDGFNRPWPNILVSDAKTREKVDNAWDSYEIGPFIPSPSLNFLTQIYPGKAEVNAE